jgi:monoterpene epsilon-lactone hydrolase
MTAPTQEPPFDVHIPETVSPQAQAFLRTLKDRRESFRDWPAADDLAGWKEFQARQEATGKDLSEPVLKRYEPTITERKLGGVPTFDVRPKGWKDNGKILVNLHNSVRVLFNAVAMGLASAARSAHETGLRVIAVDHTLAPHAKYDHMSDEVVAAIRALLQEGQRLRDMAIEGFGSGGGLAAAAVLKMRDQGLGMPAAAVLVSPWLDVTLSGDTETTLRDADPNFLYHAESAAAYAAPKDQKDPYASPVYGEFSKGFPPTLIQGGLKETLLSGFVRFYQALDLAGVPVKLDLYEGMISLFQSRIPDAPESIIARQKIRAFLYQHLRL